MAEAIVSANMQLGCKEFKGTNYHGDIVVLSMCNYGHLIRTVALSRTSFADFAEKIEAHYDQHNPQNNEVIRVLRVVHQLNA